MKCLAHNDWVSVDIVAALKLVLQNICQIVSKKWEDTCIYLIDITIIIFTYSWAVFDSKSDRGGSSIWDICFLIKISIKL